MAVDLVAEVPRHALLQPHHEVRLEEVEHVLQQDHRQDEQDHAQQDLLRLRVRLDPVADGVVEHPLERVVSAAHVERRVPEQRVQERDQHEQAERVRDRKAERRDRRGHDQAAVGPEVPQDAAVQRDVLLHRASERGNRTATGRIISSGLTPPCRNDPR